MYSTRKEQQNKLQWQYQIQARLDIFYCVEITPVVNKSAGIISLYYYDILMVQWYYSSKTAVVTSHVTL